MHSHTNALAGTTNSQRGSQVVIPGVPRKVTDEAVESHLFTLNTGEVARRDVKGRRHKDSSAEID